MKKSRIQDRQYYVIHGWMLNHLKLSGNELVIYAIIYGFSQDGSSEFSGSIDYLAQWTGISRSTVIRALKKLVENGYIIKTETYFNDVKMVKYRYSKDALTIDPNNQDNGIGGVKMTQGVSKSEECDEMHSEYQNDIGGVKMTRDMSNDNCDKISSKCQNDTGSIKMTQGVSAYYGGGVKMTHNNIADNIDLKTFDKERKDKERKLVPSVLINSSG